MSCLSKRLVQQLSPGVFQHYSKGRVLKKISTHEADPQQVSKSSLYLIWSSIFAKQLSCLMNWSFPIVPCPVFFHSLGLLYIFPCCFPFLYFFIFPFFLLFFLSSFFFPFLYTTNLRKGELSWWMYCSLTFYLMSIFDTLHYELITRYLYFNIFFKGLTRRFRKNSVKYCQENWQWQFLKKSHLSSWNIRQEI